MCGPGRLLETQKSCNAKPVNLAQCDLSVTALSDNTEPISAIRPVYQPCRLFSLMPHCGTEPGWQPYRIFAAQRPASGTRRAGHGNDGVSDGCAPYPRRPLAMLLSCYKSTCMSLYDLSTVHSFWLSWSSLAYRAISCWNQSCRALLGSTLIQLFAIHLVPSVTRQPPWRANSSKSPTQPKKWEKQNEDQD